MIKHDNFHTLIIIVYISVSTATTLSYNQPRLCPSAAWHPNATTFANGSAVGPVPSGVFVHSNNTVYVVDHNHGRILVWMNASINPAIIILGNLSASWVLFVSIDGEIYVDNGHKNNTVDKYTPSKNTSTPVIQNIKQCTGLFVDINNTLYCSMHSMHQVVKRVLSDIRMNATSLIGKGTAGNSSDRLNEPFGIFVDVNFDLYVADAKNNRIQLFGPGQSNGTTVAGNRSVNITVTLNYPTGIVLDKDKYLFIVDRKNHRIVGSGPYGFRCLVGCNSGSSGAGSHQLNEPSILSFDSYGNMFVTDRNNNRTQKFHLLNNTCDKYLVIFHPTVLAEDTGEITTTETTQISATTQITSLSTSTALYVDTGTTILREAQETTADTTSVKLSTTTDFTDLITNSSWSVATAETVQPVTISTISVLRTQSTSSTATNRSSPIYFISPPCNHSAPVDVTCNMSSSPCEVLDPCHNNGNCSDNGTGTDGYFCSCPSDFEGNRCQFDRRICKPNICWNNGQCNETENRTFVCICKPGWHGTYCQKMINHCEKTRCMNNGVCRPLLGGYKCECLYGYSDNHCNTTATKIVVYKIVSKSLAYIAVIAMISAAMFIIIMDILKYGFGIDVTHAELEKIRRKKQAKIRRRIIQRFVYVNPLPQPSSEQQVLAVTERKSREH